MIEEKLKRINELARLSRERELTPEELAERDGLRREYVAEWRRGSRSWRIPIWWMKRAANASSRKRNRETDDNIEKAVPARTGRSGA